MTPAQIAMILSLVQAGACSWTAPATHDGVTRQSAVCTVITPEHHPAPRDFHREEMFIWNGEE